MVQDEVFQLRIYRKNELAMRYFPQSSKEAALRNLGRWIARCLPLRRRLDEGGYDKRRKFFLKHEVALIVEYLGEP